MAGFKGGNGGMQNLMRQAQKMQEEMEKTAALLDDWEVVGTAAGEAVVVYMNAKKIINGIELDESIVAVIIVCIDNGKIVLNYILCGKHGLSRSPRLDSGGGRAGGSSGLQTTSHGPLALTPILEEEEDAEKTSFE